jgi:predicted dehydrogenase
MLASEELDALIVATPNDQHADIVIAALKRGRHVMCEKPLAASIEEYDRVLDAAARSSGILQVAMELRFSPLFRDVKVVLDQGTIGTPKLIWAHEFRPPFRPGISEWRRGVDRTGGTLLEKSCHHFDLFHWFASARPLRIMAMGSDDVVYPRTGLLDRAWVMVEHESGVFGSLGLSLFHPRELLQFGIVGTAGSMDVLISADEEKLVVEGRAGQQERRYDSRRGGFAHGGEVEQQFAFAKAILSGAASPLDAVTARWSHLAAIAAEVAVRRGRPVRTLASGAFAVEES